MTEIKNLEPKRNYWKSEEEDLLKQWADKAKCYHWLHNKSREIYQRKNAWFTIPVIIISTIVGTANFAQDRFSDEVRSYVVISIGSLSIIAGIITTIYQLLKISEINEAHRVSLLSWSKFYIDIEAELARHPLDRTYPSELIKISKNEYSRLLEISPFIPKKVLNEFNRKFKNNYDLIKPEIGNNINPLHLYQMDDKKRNEMINNLNKGLIIENKKMVEKKLKATHKINKFRESFLNLNNREPTKEEIKKNLRYTDEDYNSSDSLHSCESPVIDNEDNISINIKYNIVNEDNSSSNNSVNVSKKPKLSVI